MHRMNRVLGVILAGAHVLKLMFEIEVEVEVEIDIAIFSFQKIYPALDP